MKCYVLWIMNTLWLRARWNASVGMSVCPSSAAQVTSHIFLTLDHQTPRTLVRGFLSFFFVFSELTWMLLCAVLSMRFLSVLPRPTPHPSCFPWPQEPLPPSPRQGQLSSQRAPASSLAHQWPVRGQRPHQRPPGTKAACSRPLEKDRKLDRQ